MFWWNHLNLVGTEKDVTASVTSRPCGPKLVIGARSLGGLFSKFDLLTVHVHVRLWSHSEIARINLLGLAGTKRLNRRAKSRFSYNHLNGGFIPDYFTTIFDGMEKSMKNISVYTKRAANI